MLFNYDSIINHSCDPNTICLSIDENDITRFKCVTRKDINAHGKLNFNYNALIFDSKDPFDCECDAEKCYGKVKGLKYLSIDEQKDILDLIFYPLLRAHNLDYVKE